MFKFSASGYRDLEVSLVKAMPSKQKLEEFMKHELYGLRMSIRSAYSKVGLHKRTGLLKGSIEVGQVKYLGYGVEGEVLTGQGLKYAAIQEYGGTVRARNSKFLTIPVGPMLTPAGVARESLRDVIEQRKWQTFKPKNADVILGRLAGSKGDFQVLFVLKKSVTIPSRPYVRTGLADFKEQFIKDLHELVSGSFKSGAQQKGSA